MSDVTAGRREPRLKTTAARDESAFHAARRRSRWVRWLKIILPAAAVSGVIVFGSFLVFSRISDIGISIADIDIRSNELVMESPSVSGFQGTKQAYELHAARAIQNLDNPQQVRLEEIGAKIGLDSGGVETATITAATGLYNSKAETLVLSDGISISTSNGYHAELVGADVDLKEGTLKSNEQVELRSAEGSIRANGVEISQGGRHILFSRGVSVTIEASAIEDGLPREESTTP